MERAERLCGFIELGKAQPVVQWSEQVNSKSPVQRKASVDDLMIATRKVTVLLSDRKWHSAGEIRDIAKRFATTLDTLSRGVPFAVSKSGRHVCWIDDNSPAEPKPKR